MKTISIMLGLILTGCTQTISMYLVDVKHEKPLSAVRVDRWSPIGRMGKIFNPVAAVYFPVRKQESQVSDIYGKVTFKKVTDSDYFYFTVTTNDLPYLRFQNGQLVSSKEVSVKVVTGGVFKVAIPSNGIKEGAQQSSAP